MTYKNRLGLERHLLPNSSKYLKDFQKFLQDSFPFDFDIMFEIKDKEKSVLKALEVVSLDSRNK